MVLNTSGQTNPKATFYFRRVLLSGFLSSYLLIIVNICFINIFSHAIKIKLSADLVSGESPLPSLQMALLLHGREREIERERENTLVSSSYKNTSPIMGAQPSGPHLNLLTSQQFYLQIPSNWELELQHMTLAGVQTFSPLQCVCVTDE